MEPQIVMLGDMFDDGKALMRGTPQALPDFLRTVVSFGRTVNASCDYHIGMPVPRDSHEEFLRQAAQVEVPAPAIGKKKVVQHGPVRVGKGGKMKRW